ncbi:hypothetical protein Cadr_000009061 [Camelus dromedarius]|uniref:Uncharacterized protein n=1 Tax=Camelus dromedarius TaxID=9838 RepID=A0A5N4DJX4_CAMDR|nr:hypothetical protein Cadr_000009061 [Camelus dromedarius]
MEEKPGAKRTSVGGLLSNDGLTGRQGCVRERESALLTIRTLASFDIHPDVCISQYGSCGCTLITHPDQMLPEATVTVITIILTTIILIITIIIFIITITTTIITITTIIITIITIIIIITTIIITITTIIINIIITITIIITMTINIIDTAHLMRNKSTLKTLAA